MFEVVLEGPTPQDKVSSRHSVPSGPEQVQCLSRKTQRLLFLEGSHGGDLESHGRLIGRVSGDTYLAVTVMPSIWVSSTDPWVPFVPSNTFWSEGDVVPVGDTRGRGGVESGEGGEKTEEDVSVVAQKVTSGLSFPRDEGDTGKRGS